MSSLKTESEFLNSVEAAEFLRVSPGSLRNMVSDGKVPFYKLGNRLRFRREELRELLLSQPRGNRHGP